MLVRVWNDNIHPFKQEVNGKIYAVPAKECIEIEEDEADMLVKRISPIILDGNDVPKPESYKMLRIDADDIKRNRNALHNRMRAGTYLCQACGFVAANKDELDGHSLNEHKDQLDDVDEARAAVNAERSRKRKG